MEFLKFFTRQISLGDSPIWFLISHFLGLEPFKLKGRNSNALRYFHKRSLNARQRVRRLNIVYGWRLTITEQVIILWQGFFLWPLIGHNVIIPASDWLRPGIVNDDSTQKCSWLLMTFHPFFPGSHFAILNDWLTVSPRRPPSEWIMIYNTTRSMNYMSVN